MDNQKKWIYASCLVVLASIYLKLLIRSVAGSFFEQDAWWFIPFVFQSMKGLSFLQTIFNLFDPGPIMNVPSIKIFSFLLMKFFGPIAKYFIFGSIAFHVASSYLLYLLSRKLGLAVRASFAASLIYLTLFAHFGAYFWPIMSIQHVLVVFFTLLVLNLYLKTEELIGSGKSYFALYMLTILMNILASFCRISIAILPISILCLIIFESKTGFERAGRLRRWMPLFATYLFYPLLTIIYVGDIRINIFFKGINLHAAYLITLFAGLASLFVLRHLLRIADRHAGLNLFTKAIIPVTIFLIYAFMCLNDIKNILLPYNFIVPFMTVTVSFLSPLQNLLANDSTRPFYFIRPQLSSFSLLISGFLVVLFFKNSTLRNRKLAILVPWYLISFIYVNLKNPIASRYFIYVSPVFCIILADVLLYVSSLISNKIRLRGKIQDVILVLALIGLCVPNILAINLTILRERLANNFYIYDYIKTASIIKKDILTNAVNKKPKPEDISVEGVGQIVSKEWDFIPVDFSKRDNFRFVMVQIFDDRKMVDIIVNGPSSLVENAPFRYKIDDEGSTFNADGINADSFDRIFEEGMMQLRGKNYGKARDLFQRAIETRPFLLNYILPGLKLGDLKWIMRDPDLRTWLNRITCYNRSENPGEKRIEYIAAILDKESVDYIRCLFYASYLSYISGDMKNSDYTFSLIKFLESDYDKLRGLLLDVSMVRNDIGMTRFLERHGKMSLYEDPDYRNTYEFERFLFKFMFGIEVVKK